MFVPATIITAYKPLIGWDKGDTTLTEEVTKADSGQYYNSAHVLLTTENILAASPYETTAKTEAWLRKTTDSFIIKAIQNIYNNNISNNIGSIIQNSTSVFEGMGSLKWNCEKTNSLVGFEITPKRSKGTTIRIDAIGTQFKGIGDLDLYIFHSSRPDAVKKITITRTRNGGMEWNIPAEPLYLPYWSTDIDAGGQWYIVYDDSAIGDMTAINRQIDFRGNPCSGCNPGELRSWMDWHSNYNIYPIRAPRVDADEQTLWDTDVTLSTPTITYGLNFKISVVTDVTQFLVDQKSLFTDYLIKYVGSEFLRLLAYNPSVKIARGTLNWNRQEILYEIDGNTDSNRRTGLGYERDQALKALQVSLEGMDAAASPKRKNGIRFN